jgi:hypothetical protein
MSDKTELTIYDILPTLEAELVKSLHNFMKADGGAIYTWEITMFYPATNAFLHYLSGVNMSLENGNYMSVMANVRGLIEALGAVVYDGTAKLPSEAYDWFLKNGRLPKWSAKKKRWEALTLDETVENAQKAVDPRIRLKDIYAACCDIHHFSSKHMSFLAGFNPKLDDDERMVEFKIGSKDDIPVKEQREIIDFCATLSNVMGECVRLAVKEKENRKTKKN